MNNKEFINIKIEDFNTSLKLIQELRNNIKLFLLTYELTKEDITEICGLNQSQYYRRMNNNPSFSDSELLLIIEDLLKKEADRKKNEEPNK